MSVREEGHVRGGHGLVRRKEVQNKRSGHQTYKHTERITMHRISWMYSKKYGHMEYIKMCKDGGMRENMTSNGGGRSILYM